MGSRYITDLIALRAYRLRHECCATTGDPLEIQRFGGVARQENDADAWVEIDDALGQLDTGHVRHHDIGHEDVDRFAPAPDLGHRFGAIGDGDDLEAGPFQNRSGHIPDGRFVLHYEDGPGTL